MPIDIRLLGHDESLWSDLETSFAARHVGRNEEDANEHSHSHQLTTSLRRLIDKARVSRQELETCRSQRKKKQPVDKDALQGLEDADQQAQLALSQQLANSPNYVDKSIHSHVDGNGGETTRSMIAKNSQSDGVCVDQVMFNVGGYELLGKVHVPTRLGRDILQSVEDFMIEACQQVSSPVQTELLELPLTLPVDESILQKRWHSLGPDKTIFGAPSWLSLVEHHLTSHESYFDRVLPQNYLLSCRGASQYKTALRSMKPPHPCWYKDLSVQHQLQVLLLTGPSLSIDSRPLQLEWVDGMKQAYRQLAPHADLRICAIPAPDLEPSEASRLVLEGYLPHQKNQPIVLATLSNYLDYCSTGLRHGNSIDKRNVHLLHGTVCDVGLAVEWMLQHCQQSETVDNVQLPDCIRQGERLTFRRRIVKNKGGKTFVQAMPVARPRIAPPETVPSAALNKGKEMELMATPEMIRKEAASCPFDFLPFYYR